MKIFVVNLCVVRRTLLMWGQVKSKMAGSKLETYISACTQESINIPEATPMFLGSSYPIKLVAML